MVRCAPNMPLATRKIGLLGGSFNPAHAGHFHLSLHALKALGLNEIWWLVSPQNPLKSPKELAAYQTRYDHAETLTAKHPQIKTSAFEAERQLRYSIDTITDIQQAHSRTQFVWLMGADNLASFHHWYQWQQMFASIPIAIFDRAPYSLSALNSKAAKRFSKNRVDERDAKLLPTLNSPAWSYITMPRHPQSATDLRKKLGNKAFLGHNKGVS